MIYGIIIFISSIIFITVFLLRKQGNVGGSCFDSDRLLKLSRFQFEAPNRIRIFNDSIKLVQSTQNANTFIGRVKEIDMFTEWSFEQLRDGMPLTTYGRNHLEMVRSYRNMINRNALRVAQAEFAKWSKVRRVNGKVFDKATIKIFEALDNLVDCLETGDNKNEIQSEISNIRNLVEDIYSNVKE